MKIAYLCNVYPAPTHTFIRREIKGVEQEGIEVKRTSIRRSADALPSPEDIEELERTFCVLERGIFPLLTGLLVVGVMQPVAAARAFWRAVLLGVRSEAGLLKHMAYLAEACVVLRYAHKVEFTHIHAHFGTNAATVAMLVRSLGGPTFSFTIHGPGEWDCPAFLHVPKKVEEASFVIAISDFAKSQTYRWTDPKHWSKIHVVRCGVDQSFISEPISSVPDVTRLVMVGRLGRSKGHIILLEALQRLATRGIECNVKLVGDGPMRNLIEQQINVRGLQDYVEIAGWMDNNSVRKELLACRAMVLPSFGEGLPVVIMECLALARPVVCTRIAGIGELVIDRENGWLVNAGSVDELANALQNVLETPVSELSKMGAAGRVAVLQKHDAIVEARKLSDLLKRYCDKHERNN
jgi:glycosyltransferase involved in cell wall biosynthesis